MVLVQTEGNLLRAWSANPVHSGVEGGTPQDSPHFKTGGRWEGLWQAGLPQVRTQELLTGLHWSRLKRSQARESMFNGVTLVNLTIFFDILLGFLTVPH